MKKNKIILIIASFVLFFALICFLLDRKTIDVDITNHTLTACENKFKCFTVPVTTGGETSPTRRGEFEVLNKLENVKGIYVYTYPHWLGIYEVGEYENEIHSVAGRNPWTEYVGEKDVTSGSVVLSIEDMQRVYDFAEVGTPVYIHE